MLLYVSCFKMIKCSSERQRRRGKGKLHVCVCVLIASQLRRYQSTTHKKRILSTHTPCLPAFFFSCALCAQNAVARLDNTRFVLQLVYQLVDVGDLDTSLARRWLLHLDNFDAWRQVDAEAVCC